jgi:hypothetical protein
MAVGTLSQGPPIWPEYAGRADTSIGKDGNFYHGSYADFWVIPIVNSIAIAGDIVSWDEGAVFGVRKRTSNSRMPCGVLLDTPGSLNELVRVAHAGVVDVIYNGSNRNSRGDYMQAGDVAAQYHIAKYGFGNFQIGRNVSYAGLNYSTGWVRVYLNMYSR